MVRSALSRNRITQAEAAIEDSSLTTGERFYVHSGAGSNSNTGRTPDTPFASLVFALTQVSENTNDVIYIMPGHAETLTGAAHIACNKIGVTIIGLGTGTNRPTFTFGNTAATWAISAANVTVKNIRVTSSVDEMVKMFHVTAAYCTLDNIEHFETTSMQTLQFLLTSALANNITVKNCEHYQVTAAAGTQKWIELVGVTRARILDNLFILTLKDETASHTISGSTAVINVEIARNIFIQRAAANTQTTVVNLVTTSSGFIHDNRAGTSSTGVSTAAAFTGDACFFSENYWLDDPAASGILAPGAGSD